MKLTTGKVTKLFALIATMLMLVSVSMVSVPVEASSTVFTPATATLLAGGLNMPWGLGVFTGASVLVNTESGLWLCFGGSKYLVTTPSNPLTFSRMRGTRYVVGDIAGNIYELSGKSLKLLTSITGSIFGLDIDKNGDVYFIDLGAHFVIYRLPWGSNEPVFVAMLNFIASGVAVKGNTLYVSDYDWGKIWTLSKTGGSPTLFASGLNGPQDLIFDRMGNLYVAESVGGSIAFIRAGSTTVKRIATGFGYPPSLGLDIAGYLYFTDLETGKLWMIKPY
jgi:hypothetical protein